MARDLYVNGPCLVKVKGRGALADTIGGEAVLRELGLSTGQIRIIPNFIHRDIQCDDFGGDVPAEIMCMLSDVQIHMVLVHFDEEVLDQCMSNSLGGYYNVDNEPAFDPGIMAGAGKLLGGGREIFGTNNLFMSLNLTAPGEAAADGENISLKRPWRFPAAYIPANPLDIPLGTDRSQIVLRWRAIPYVPTVEPISPGESGAVRLRGIEPKSRGAILWSRTADTA